MMNLNQIVAGDATELTKIASIAGEFVAGNISAEEGNNLALAANIHPDRVVAFVQENEYELQKEAMTAEPTYLEKVAHIVDDAYAGAISEYDLEKIAHENGIAMRDIDAIAGMAYGQELTKEAYYQEVEDVLDDAYAPYILKTASIAALVSNDLMSEEDAFQTASNYGIGFDDLEYELEKEAEKKAEEEKPGVFKRGYEKVKDAGRWVGKNKGKTALGVAGVGTLGAGTYYATRK